MGDENTPLPAASGPTLAPPEVTTAAAADVTALKPSSAATADVLAPVDLNAGAGAGAAATVRPSTWKVGQVVDCQDAYGAWYEGTIEEVG